MQTYILNIRPKRQTTLPDMLLKQLDLDIGDKLKAEIKNDRIVLTPQKRVALDAFDEIQKIFAESSIPEREMQNNLKKIRKELYAQRAS
jgi:antitoxin component of MazEF toxin-antitoxin module